MSTCVIGGAPPAAWQGPDKTNPETPDTPCGRLDSGTFTPRFKLIVDD